MSRPRLTYKEKEARDLRYVVNNGITLCSFHHPHGRKNEQAKVKYFMEIVKNTTS